MQVTGPAWPSIGDVMISDVVVIPQEGVGGRFGDVIVLGLASRCVVSGRVCPVTLTAK